MQAAYSHQTQNSIKLSFSYALRCVIATCFQVNEQPVWFIINTIQYKIQETRQRHPPRFTDPDDESGP